MHHRWLRGWLVSAIVLCVMAGSTVGYAEEDGSNDDSTTSSQREKTEKDKAKEKSKKEGEESAAWGSASSDVQSESARRTQSSSKNWSVSLALSSRIGQGTFADAKNDTNVSGEFQPLESSFDSARLGYEISASYRLDKFIFSGGIEWTQGLSPGVGVEDPQQIWFNDTSLDVNWLGETIDPIGLNVSANLGFEFPTGLTSRTTTQIMDVDASASIRRTFFERLTLSYSMGGSKKFHNYKVPAVDESQVGSGNYLHEQDLDRGLAAIQGVNTEWGWSNSLSASVRVWSRLSASMRYSYIRNWTYYRETDDQFQSQFSDSGRGVEDFLLTSLSLSYPFAQYFSVSGGIYSQSFPKTADQRSLNFPFWNFAGAASNESGFFLSFSGSY